MQLLLLYESTTGHKNYLYLTGIQLITSCAKFVPLIFYHLPSNALDIYKLKKVKNRETIKLERSMD